MSKLIIKGELINKGLSFTDKISTKYDETYKYRYAIAKPVLEYSDVDGKQVYFLNDDKTFKSAYVNFATKYLLKVYFNGEKATEYPSNGSEVEVLFNVTDTSVYPVAINVVKYKRFTNPFEV